MQQISISFQNCVFSQPVQGKLELALLSPRLLLLPRAPLLHQQVAHFFHEQLALPLQPQLDTLLLRLTVIDFQLKRNESLVQIDVRVRDREERQVQVHWSEFSGRLRYQIWRGDEIEEQQICQSVVCQQFDKNLPVSIQSFIELYRKKQSSENHHSRLFDLQKGLDRPADKLSWNALSALVLGCFLIALVL